MPAVQTVLGEIDASELGFTLSHEHIIVSNGQDAQNYPWLYDRAKTLEAAVTRMRELRQEGCHPSHTIAPVPGVRRPATLDT